MGEKTIGVDKKTLNIYQKLAAIMGEIGAIQKGGTNKEQSYAFIEYAAVAGKLRSLFSDYGVVIVPRMPTAATHVREEITTQYGKKGVAILIDFRFEIINADKPDDKFEVTWTGEAADYGDKGTNKAATSALKYYLMRQFNISEKGEDNDAHSIDRGGKQSPAAKPVAKKVTYISTATIKAISDELQAKGIAADDIDDAIKKLGKTTDIKKINAATGQAILTKIKSAKGDGLRHFVYGEQVPVLPEDSTEEPTSNDPSPSKGLAKATAKPAVDDEFKDMTWTMFEELPLIGAYKIRFLKDVTGKMSRNTMTDDEQWRVLYDRVLEITSGDTPLPAEYTEKAKA